MSTRWTGLFFKRCWSEMSINSLVLGNMMIFLNHHAHVVAFTSRMVYMSLLSETVFTNDHFSGSLEDGPRSAYRPFLVGLQCSLRLLVASVTTNRRSHNNISWPNWAIGYLRPPLDCTRLVWESCRVNLVDVWCALRYCSKLACANRLSQCRVEITVAD